MARTYLRFLIAIALAVVIEHLRAELHVTWPALGRSGLALAQRIPDPGFGDPNATTYGLGAGGGMGGYGGNPNFPTTLGPTAPLRPTSPVRPPTWPGGSQDPTRPAAAGPPGAARVATAMPSSALSAAGIGSGKSPADPPYDPASILARVGSEVIQANELLPMVNRALEANIAPHAAEIAALAPDVRERELNRARRNYMKQAVNEMISTKLLLSELRRRVPEEGLKKSDKQVRDYFNSEGINHLKADYKATSIVDLDNKLRSLGSSLEAQRTVFMEQQLASYWLKEQVKKEDKEPSLEQMLDYYREHAVDWETPARVRWEQLTAKFTNFDSKEQAYASLALWGNDIVVRGVPFAQVAKAHSQDFAGEEGGLHDWATRGSLRSTILDQALFVLPPAALSQVIEDDDGFHIVRVIERQEAKRTPFSEVQPEIKLKMHDGGKDQQRREYLAKLRGYIPVWTVFDQDSPDRSNPTGEPTATR